MNNKNGVFIKLLTVLSVICLICLCKFTFLDASAKQIIEDYDSKNDSISLFSYDDSFIMVKSSVNKTVIIGLDSNGNVVNPLLHTFDFSGAWYKDQDYKYVGSILSEGSIYIVYNYIDTSLANHMPKTQIIKYVISERKASSRVIEGINLLSINDLTVGSNGKIFIVRSMLRNRINIVNYPCVNKDSKIIRTENSINSIKTNPSKDKLYVYCDNDFYYYDLTKDDYKQIRCGEIPTGNYNFLDDNTIIDSKCNVYELIDGKFCYKFNTLSKHKDVITMKVKDGIISTMSPHLLYCFDENAKVTGEQKLEGNIIEICKGNSSTLVITSNSENGLCCEKLSLSSVIAENISDNVEHQDKDNIIQNYKEALPNNKDINKVYVKMADLKTFTECGEVSKAVLDDGLRAVNFYRKLYGLKDAALDADLTDICQHSSVLALSLDDVNKPIKPNNMSNEFYVRAMQSDSYKPNCIKIFTELDVSPIYKAVDSLFKTNEYFRSYILNPNVNVIGLGCCTDDKHRTSVVVGTDNVNNTNSDINYTTYPSAAYYPFDLLDKNDKWSIHLNPHKYQVSKRGMPSISIKSGSSTYMLNCKSDIELSINNNCIKFLCPDFKENSSYKIAVDNLYDVNGIAARLEYSVTLFKLPKYDVKLDSKLNSISSSVYNIDNKHKIITGVKPSTTVSVFKSNIEHDGYTIKIINYRNKEVTSGGIGTSAKAIFLCDNKAAVEYTIVVYGDLTGEGNVNNNDKNELYKHLLGKKKLTGYFKMAADVNHDGIINTLDLLLLNNYIDGKSDIDQYPKIHENLLK